jgi:hypothetical protein
MIQMIICYDDIDIKENNLIKCWQWNIEMYIELQVFFTKVFYSLKLLI